MSVPKQPIKSSQPQSSSFVQLIVNFVIPTIILLRLSGESALGPTKAMLLALAFPIAFELYSLTQRRKPNILSLIAIGGIIVTGAISLLGLSENWLAVRRSVPYVVVALVLFGSLLLKRSLIDLGLKKVIDMEQVMGAAKKNGTEVALRKNIQLISYFLVVFLVIIGISSFILTLSVIHSPTDTAAFNSEYARLRIISLPATTLPILVGIVGMLLYLFNKIEKLTGLSAEDLVVKNKK